MPHPLLNEIGRDRSDGGLNAESVPQASATGHRPRNVRFLEHCLEMTPRGYAVEQPYLPTGRRLEGRDHRPEFHRYRYGSEQNSAALERANSDGYRLPVKMLGQKCQCFGYAATCICKKISQRLNVWTAIIRRREDATAF